MAEDQQQKSCGAAAAAATKIAAFTVLCGGFWAFWPTDGFKPPGSWAPVSRGPRNVAAADNSFDSQLTASGLQRAVDGEPFALAATESFGMVPASVVPELRLFRSSRFGVHVAELEPLWDSSCGSNLRNYVDQKPNVSAIGDKAGVRSHSAYSSKFMAEITLPLEVARSRFSVDTPAEADIVLLGLCVMARGKQGSAIATVVSRIKRNPELATIWGSRRRDLVAVVTSDHGPCPNFRESLNRHVG